MNDIEKIYDQALQMLQKGHSQKEILAAFPEAANELAPLLELSRSLFTVPKNIAPTPLMQRKYAAVPVKHAWLLWLKVSKFASVSVGVVLLVSALAATGYAAAQSAPGQSFFGLKKTAEQIQVALAGSQNAKASLQVAIAQQRLTEAQAIFSNPDSDPSQQSAALNELASQTSTAVADVNTVAQSNPQSDQNHPLLSSLENITQAQATLLTQIKPDSQIQGAAQSALASLNQSSAQLSQIKQTVAVANNSQTLANLSSNPNSVAVLGQVNKFSTSQITVEKTSFVLTPETVIQDDQGDTLTTQNLTVGQRVNLTGINNNGILIAQLIVVINQPQDTQGSVEGVSTSTPATTTPVELSGSTAAAPNAATSTPASLLPIPTPAAAPTPVNSSSTAVGAFIIENPSPQYSQ